MKIKFDFNFIFILALIPSLFWQYKTTHLQWLWQQTPAEYNLQYRNINLYPVSLLRIGNQLENKKYFQLFFKSLDRFFYPLNFNLQFSNWRLILLPLFILGLFKLHKKDLLTFYILLFSPLIMVNIIGYINLVMYAFYPLIFWLNLKCILKK
jgi:hypothetical protein